LGHILSVNQLSAGYGKLVILHDLTLQFDTDQFTAILGPNGSGKSTLLKSVFGLTTIFGGSIQYDGRELVGLAAETVGHYGIAYVPQRGNVFTSMSVQENLLLAMRKVSAGDKQQGLDAAYELFPILTKRRTQRAGHLSGGERQMLAIAMGWLARPRLMLLDEPTAGLAPLVANALFQTLQRLRHQDITIVVVEQNARSVLRWCDKVFVLRAGQLVFEGTAQECLHNEEMLKGYLGMGQVIDANAEDKFRAASS
jgi:branched-chain amino acid transport system ATP-binding protein